MRPLLILCIAGLLACFHSTVHAQTSMGLGKQPTLILQDVHVVSGTPGTLMPNRNVLIQGGKIRAVSEALPERWPTDAQRVDGKGAFLSPGFVDAHAHLPRIAEGVGEQDLKRSYRDFLRFGVLHVRSMRGLPEDPLLRTRLLAGDWLGPNMYLCAPPLSSRRMPGLEDSQDWLQAQKDAGFDAIKVLSGLDGTDHAAWASKAHGMGLHWLGHAPGTGLRGCFTAGMDGVEHITPFVRAALEGKDSLQESLLALGERSVSHSGNLLYYQRLAHRIPLEELQALPGVEQAPKAWKLEWLEDLKRTKETGDRYGSMLDQYLAFQPEIQASGIRLLLSPSAGPFILPGYSYLQEARLLASGGLTPEQVWRAATGSAYQAMGMGERAGQVKEGFAANLVLLEGNPLEDVEAMGQVRGVVLRGQWLSAEALAGGK